MPSYSIVLLQYIEILANHSDEDDPYAAHDSPKS